VPAIEGLKSCFGSSWFDVTEAIRKRRDLSVKFSKDSLNSAPISVAPHLKSEPGSLECCLEVLSAIDEKHGGFDVVLLAEFAEKHLDEGGSRR
jgi:hypothetical protein